LQALFPPRRQAAAGAVAFDVRSLTPTRGATSLGFKLRRGEIVGLGGLEGQGQREIVRCLAGVLNPQASDVWKADASGSPQRFDPASGVVHAVAQGVGLIPEDRKLEGLYLDLPIADNIGLGRLRGLGLWRKAPRDRTAIEQSADRMLLHARDLDQEVGALSGGNQQKVMLGRWLAAGVDTLLVEQPTRGVDVGAKAEIYVLLREFVDSGGTVLAVSSDLPELIGLCDRILMVRGGAIVGDVDAHGATEESLLALALADAQTTVDTAA
jgi:ribose transport system ATP-binding protein